MSGCVSNKVAGSVTIRMRVSEREKELIIGHYMENNSMSLTATIVRRSKSVVGRVIKRYYEENSLAEKKKTGRPRKTTIREDREIVRMSMKDRFETAASISREFSKTSGKSISRDSVSRRLKDRGLYAMVPLSKPLVSKKNQKTRLAFAAKHVVWSEEQWNQVWFSDESKFNVFGSDGRVHVRRKTGERFSPNCVKTTVKFGGGSVMVWGMISSSGVGPLIRLHGKVNAEVYKQLLDQHVLPVFYASSQNPVFMQDNAPCHKAKKVMDFLKANNVTTMEWPPQSPDLNPIENVWKLIGERTQKSNPKNQDHLWRLLSNEWNQITPLFCNNLIKSCNRRCAAVIERRGLFTKY